MADIFSTDDLASMTNLAAQNGAFFFALLFTLVITALARKWSRDVSLQNPPASAKDVTVYRLYFAACAVASFLLVGFSVWYWYEEQNQSRRHVLVVDVVGVSKTEFLAADNLLREEKERRDPMTYREVKDVKFVMIRKKPFKRGETVVLNYWKKSADGEGVMGEEAPAPTQVSINIGDPRPSLHYKYCLKKKGDSVVLQPTA